MGVMVLASPSAASARAAHRPPNKVGVHLWEIGRPDLPGLGKQLLTAARRQLPGPPSVQAWDFLAIATAAFAADRFVLRGKTPDAWTRHIGLEVGLADPTAWQAEAGALEAALRFLTGDIWSLRFVDGGLAPPATARRAHDRDCVCLFSGGLDSFIGALDLVNASRRPLLVSQGTTKEVEPQRQLAQALGLEQHRFEGRVRERWKQPYEGSTRGRSILFFGYGAVAASALGLPEVIVPENALIAINPPFTSRRMGSLSTRTTHPYFIEQLNAILARTGVGVALRNPYAAMTKGEMLDAANHPKLGGLAAASYSCGKGKRANGQCGRCVPCLIRRASFEAASLPDKTVYVNSLASSAQADDVLAARQAATRARNLSPAELTRWVQRAGPLPSNAAARSAIVAAVGRGLAELDDLFITAGWP